MLLPEPPQLTGLAEGHKGRIKSNPSRASSAPTMDTINDPWMSKLMRCPYFTSSIAPGVNCHKFYIWNGWLL